jgi:hypothetical protein
MGTWTAAVYTAEQQARLGVTEMGEAAKKSKVVLSPKAGGNNYADCDGVYELDAAVTLNGKPIYVNAQKERFIGWNGKSWVVTAMSYKPKILSGEITSPFGGFHASLNIGEHGLEASIWAEYSLAPMTAEETTPVQPTSQSTKLEGHENGCVSKEDGVWCPQNDGSWVNEITGKTWRKQAKAYREGCVNKDDGLWCPQADGTWINVDNGRKWSRTQMYALLGGMAVSAVLLCGLLVALIYSRRQSNARRYQEQVDTSAPMTSAAPAPPSYPADEPHPPAYVETESPPPAYSSTV